MASSRVLACLTRHVVASSLVLLALLALLDHVTGVEATFVVLTYLLPIAAVAWHRSRGAALGVAVAATVCTMVIFVDTQPLARGIHVALNGLGAFGMFAVTIWILHALRGHVDRERAQRRAAVEQLRHAERLNVIGTLAAGVAHELGTPLNVISGAAEIMGEREQSSAKTAQLAALILRQTEQITAIIRHLLDFGRRAGSTSSTIDLDPTVAGTVELLSTTARKRDVVVRFSPQTSGMRHVCAGGRELEQVVSNLMLNGIQAMPRGGTLHVSTRIETLHGASFAAVIVEDEGAGIQPEHLPLIFDPFFTTKGVGEGTGLGLSVSYGIVSDWGGMIEVASTPGSGSSFVVLIPLAAE
jgi:two-component system, NtrC family, sensor kinase